MNRFLLIDDHEVFRHGTRAVLAASFPGAQFGEASSARDGLQELEQHPCDLLVLDISLPGRDGLDFLGDVKQRWPKLPVVVLSAHAEEEFAVRCLRLGAAGYVAKAATSHELTAAVRRALEGGKYVTPLLAERLAGLLDASQPQKPHETLSGREMQVLRLVAQGKSIKEIATDLALSEKTIGTYRSRISQKLGLSTNVQVTRYALQQKLVD
jgi:two-component system invasion response regulator UvrY